MTDDPKLRPATVVAQALGAGDAATGAILPPLYSVTTFARGADYRFPGKWEYGRPDNPTVEQAEAVLAALEGGTGCLLFGSGMAAATSVFLALRPGDHVVAPKVMYWALRSWLTETLRAWGVEIDLVDMTDLDALRQAMRPGKTQIVWIETPANPSWEVTDIAAAAEIAHAAGALLVVVADPVNLGVLEGPGKLGADIVVGEGQGLGVPVGFGGPNLGVFAAKNELVRRMPGRLVGATVDRDGKRGFVLTLQTREQHIRRAKATSNICTNVALCALMATIYLATVGRRGLVKVGELSTAKAHYAAERLAKVPGVSLRFAAPFFKEFALKLPKVPDRLVPRLAKQGFLAGVPLKTFDRALADCLLVAVTEKRTKAEIDAFAAALEKAVA
jgi:glycine dehydrogenase subunit 1